MEGRDGCHASGFSKNTTLRETSYDRLETTSRICLLANLQSHPLAEKLHVRAIRVSPWNGRLVARQNSPTQGVLICRFNGSIGEQLVGLGL
jgi:hypothetical protein